MITYNNFDQRWNSDYERARALNDILETRAVGGRGDTKVYEYLREYFYKDPYLRSLLPKFVQTCRNMEQFWSFIKNEYQTYAERTNYLRIEFNPLLDHLEAGELTPLDTIVADGLQAFNADAIHLCWKRALERRESEPDGAITAARSLLETVCKHILDERSIEYDEETKLPKLYRLTSKQLNLAPEQHQEEIFKQILGGCKSVVEGLGSLRNKLGDAHGKGKRRVKPSDRHAELAVNLAGAMAVFLVETYNFQYPSKPT